MSSNEILGSATLKLQISQLKAERTALEDDLNQSFDELKQLIFNPANTLKKKTSEEQSGKRDLINLSKAVLNMGTDYLIEQKFGKKQKWSDLLTSITIELVSLPLINNSISKLFSKLANNFLEKLDQNTEQQ